MCVVTNPAMAGPDVTMEMTAVHRRDDNDNNDSCIICLHDASEASPVRNMSGCFERCECVSTKFHDECWQTFITSEAEHRCPTCSSPWADIEIVSMTESAVSAPSVPPTPQPQPRPSGPPITRRSTVLIIFAQIVYCEAMIDGMIAAAVMELNGAPPLMVYLVLGNLPRYIFGALSGVLDLKCMEFGVLYQWTKVTKLRRAAFIVFTCYMTAMMFGVFVLFWGGWGVDHQQPIFEVVSLAIFTELFFILLVLALGMMFAIVDCFARCLGCS